MRHHQCRHRLVRILPEGELLAGQPERLLVTVEGLGIFAGIEVTVAAEGLLLPVHHAVVRLGGTDPPFHPACCHGSNTQMIIIII
ncbi:hypothetical protein D3C79_870600 [compost metagenome]